MIRISTLLTTVVLTGCATVPGPLQGDYTVIAAREAAVGNQVRIGGRVIETTPTADSTCLEVLGKPLLASSRPRDGDATEGRFLACKKGSFLDPEIFVRGRAVTLTGTVEGFVEERIGDAPYRMPKIDVAEIVLWPERTEPTIIVEHPPFWGWPFCGRYGCW